MRHDPTVLSQLTCDTERLRELARRIRIHALRMTAAAGSSHVGSCLSCADILAVLYGGVLKVRSDKPHWAGRDRFIMSKGHAAAALYAALAECGFLPVEELAGFYQNGGRLSGHVSHHVPGVEVSTGSLGHGLAIGAGMAYAAKLEDAKHRVLVLLSDGECDEGSVWEAALFASHYGLDRLIAIIDYNKIQSLGPVADTLALEPFRQKWEAFGWAVREVDGHDYRQLVGALSSLPAAVGKPTCVIAHTIKGKGVSFMENSVLWHYRAPRGEEYEAALAELEQAE
jgi:transketolase